MTSRGESDVLLVDVGELTAANAAAAAAAPGRDSGGGEGDDEYEV